jgi:peroxiredoxin Q/BCP
MTHLIKDFFRIAVAISFMVVPSMAHSKSELIGKPSPLFELKNQKNETFKLADRKDKGYTVLFFYPKAGTPGCTKQACAFRDSVKVIRDKGAEIYGVSWDSVADQKKFHEEHSMTFDLLSDAEGKVINQFGLKMPVVSMAKRQTFILDEKLVIREHFEDVDPALDAKNVTNAIDKLKSAK